MSGAKFFIPMLAVEVAMIIAASNDASFKTAAQSRQVAAEEERHSRLSATRDSCLMEMRDAYVLLQERDALAPQEAQRLRAECEAVHLALTTAQSDKDIRSAASRIPDLVYHVSSAVAKHREQTAWTARHEEEQERDRQSRQRRMEAARAATELHALSAGLQADPMVMRWHSQGILRLAAEIERAPAVDSAEFLLEANRRASDMIVEAKAAQLKADQRDYIARSIMQSLAGMGFVVSEPTSEHAEHPAAAKILHAANSAGKSIAVSVPVEGEVWYEVDGYLKTTQAKIGGGVALACDEGEAVLTEMHERLNGEFHVEAGELRWEDKDPQRTLRKADQLPASATSNVRERAQ